MAQLAYSEGVPSVAPETRAPDDYQHITANPSSFGGEIARGLEKAGQGLTETSTNLFNIAAFAGKVNVDDQVNKWITTRDRILYGDPNTPMTGPDGIPVLGPDGKPKPDLGYVGLEGRAPSDARAGTLDRLEQERAAGRKNLTSPQEQFEYDVQTRRMYTDAANKIGAHADQQWKGWAAGVNNSAAANSLTGFVRNLDNPTEMAHNASDYINYKVQQAQIAFGDDPAVKTRVIADAKRDLLKAQTEAVAVHDPARAMQILEKNKDIAGLLYDDLANKFRTRAESQQGDMVADKAIREASGGTTPGGPATPVVPVGDGAAARPATPATAERVHGAIIKQESGGNLNVGTSIDGAQGVGQITPGTFAQFARPGERIDNPQDNYAVSRRIIDTYYQKYNGDAARVAVAYFSGPGNVAPPGSATPWIADRADGNGKRTSSYVADITGRLGVPNTAPQTPATIKSDAYKIVLDQALPPNVEAHALQRINRQYAAAQIAFDNDAKARSQLNEQAANQYVTRMLTPSANLSTMAAEIANDPKLTSQTKLHLTDALQKHGGTDLAHAPQTYGPGFWDAYQAVTKQPGQEGRIADVNELYRRAGPGGDLTLAGVEKLSHVMATNVKSVNDQAVNTSKTGLMNYAKSQLSFEQDTGPIKIRDPKGEAIFNAQFIPKFLAAYDKWTKDGKDPWEFLTRENVDKFVKGMRNKTEMDMERLRATGDVAPEGAQQPAPPAPQGVNETGWRTVMQSPPKAESGKTWPMANWAAAVNALRADPTPENMAAFNAIFGRAGYDAKEIVGKLAPGALRASFTMPQLMEGVAP